MNRSECFNSKNKKFFLLAHCENKFYCKNYKKSNPSFRERTYFVDLFGIVAKVGGG